MILIAVDTANFTTHRNLYNSFTNSSMQLYAMACDDQVKGSTRKIGACNFSGDYMMNAIFSIRHAVELAIKSLIKVISDDDVAGHNIKRLWEKIPNHSKFAPPGSEIGNAFKALDRLGILEDGQRFRYMLAKNGDPLPGNDTVSSSDYEDILGGVNALDDLILQCMHIKKGLSLY